MLFVIFAHFPIVMDTVWTPLLRFRLSWFSVKLHFTLNQDRTVLVALGRRFVFDSQGGPGGVSG
jgi:hypothetical protein